MVWIFEKHSSVIDETHASWLAGEDYFIVFTIVNVPLENFLATEKFIPAGFSRWCFKHTDESWSKLRLLDLERNFFKPFNAFMLAWFETQIFGNDNTAAYEMM